MRRGRLARAGQLVLRRLVVIVLFTFVASLLSGTASQVLHSFAGADPIAAHSDGTPCPDPTDGDHACGPACSCACCHVQVGVPDVPSYQTSEWLPAFLTMGDAIRDDLHPKDVDFRVFHPPRA